MLMGVDGNPDWEEAGRRIKAARKIKGLSARKAAKLASMSATYWQDIERGGRLDGGRFNPSSQKLESAARTVGLTPAPIFELVCRPYTPSLVDTPLDRLDALEERLSLLEEQVGHLGQPLNVDNNRAEAR